MTVRREYITCHTIDNAYSAAADRLENGLRRFNIPLTKYPYTTTGNWFRNTHYKVVAIQKAFDSGADEIVCLDADSIIYQNPNPYFDKIREDIAVHYFVRPDGSCVVSGGTYFIRRTKQTLSLIDRWLRECAISHHRPEDTVLQGFMDTKTTHMLPITMCNFKYQSDDTIIGHARLSQNRDTWKKIKAPIRYGIDGTITLIRQSKETERWLDDQYVRIAENQWVARSKPLLDHFAGFCEGQIVNIIGKGPSLDKICLDHLQNLTTFCINDSVHAIEKLGIENTLFCVLQDCPVLKGRLPKATIFCPTRCAFNYVNGYNFTESEFGVTPNTLSAIVAMTIAKRLGAIGFRLFAFDAADGNVEYAKSLGYSPGLVSSPLRFREHWSRIEEYLRQIDYQRVHV